MRQWFEELAEVITKSIGLCLLKHVFEYLSWVNLKFVSGKLARRFSGLKENAPSCVACIIATQLLDARTVHENGSERASILVDSRQHDVRKPVGRHVGNLNTSRHVHVVARMQAIQIIVLEDILPNNHSTS